MLDILYVLRGYSTGYYNLISFKYLLVLHLFVPPPPKKKKFLPQHPLNIYLLIRLESISKDRDHTNVYTCKVGVFCIEELYMCFNKYPELQLAVNNNYSRSSCLPAILIILQANFYYCPFVVVLFFLVCVNKPFILN